MKQAKQKKNENVVGPLIAVNTKFANYVLCPSNAISQSFGSIKPNVRCTFITLDNAKCDYEFIGTWQNAEGMFNDELEDLCKRLWNVSFQSVQSTFMSRLPFLSNTWHLIKLTKK